MLENAAFTFESCYVRLADIAGHTMVERTRPPREGQKRFHFQVEANF